MLLYDEYYVNPLDFPSYEDALNHCEDVYNKYPSLYVNMFIQNFEFEKTLSDKYLTEDGRFNTPDFLYGLPLVDLKNPYDFQHSYEKFYRTEVITTFEKVASDLKIETTKDLIDNWLYTFETTVSKRLLDLERFGSKDLTNKVMSIIKS